MHNKFFFVIIFLLSSAYLFSESEGSSPEKIKKELLSDITAVSDQEKKNRYLTIAELNQISGNLNEAAEYFEKASLTVKGHKDFEALYKSAVLNTEMAFYRKAETQVRVVITFTEDDFLSLKSKTLSAKLKYLQDEFEESYLILSNVITAKTLPSETILFLKEFYDARHNDMSLPGFEKVISENEKILSAQAGIDKMITPESLFNNFIEVTDSNSEDVKDVKTITEAKTEDEKEAHAQFFQIGSFTVKDNSEKLLKSLKKSGFDAIIKEKDVNDKKYFSVVVPIDEDTDVQDIFVRLKDAGYEGYLVYQ